MIAESTIYTNNSNSEVNLVVSCPYNDDGYKQEIEEDLDYNVALIAIYNVVVVCGIDHPRPIQLQSTYG